jgi:hypothetical protein
MTLAAGVQDTLLSGASGGASPGWRVGGAAVGVGRGLRAENSVRVGVATKGSPRRRKESVQP